MIGEKIIRIEEDSFNTNDRTFEGFIIITNKQSIKLGISNGQGCYEAWGYFITNDVVEFLDAEINSITIVDDCLTQDKYLSEIGRIYEGGVMFVNINTNKGVLQFTAYNIHNGYYGHHAVVVISEQLNIDTII